MINDFGGDNLNHLKNSQLLDGSSAKELHDKIKSITGIFRVVWIWSSGSSHYAIINLERQFNGDLNQAINEKKARIKKDK